MSTNASPADERSGRARPRRDRRQALIDAAIELISEGPETDSSAAAISRRAGVAHGLLFYYFTNKQGLIAAAMADMLGKLAQFQSPRPEEASVRERLEGFVRRHVEFLHGNRALYERVVRKGELGDAVVEDAVRAARAEGARQVAALAELPDPLSPLMTAAVTGWTGFLDRTADAYFDGSGVTLDELVELVVDTFDAVVKAASRPLP